MNVKGKSRDLALHRLKQAEESLDEAKYLYDGHRSPRSVINRAYYAMFYSVLALLIFEPFSSSKHSGVLSYFNRRFVKSGLFPENLGRAINKAFDLRQRSDYREEVILTREQVSPYLDWATQFVDSTTVFLKESGSI